jgi:hypothetical protein
MTKDSEPNGSKHSPNLCYILRKLNQKSRWNDFIQIIFFSFPVVPDWTTRRCIPEDSNLNTYYVLWMFSLLSNNDVYYIKDTILADDTVS